MIGGLEMRRLNDFYMKFFFAFFGNPFLVTGFHVERSRGEVLLELDGLFR